MASKIMSGLVVVALMAQVPAMAQGYQPKGWVWHDPQDGIGSPGLNAKDKRQHLCAGILAGSWGALLAEHWGSTHPWIWGLVTGLAIGYLKEVYDLRKGSGTAEHADALWTATGGAIGAVIVKVRW